MTARRDRRPDAGQRGIPGLDRDRLWSRLPPRTTDPLDHGDACADCQGTAVNLGAPEPEGTCSSCDDSGWAP